MVSQVLKSKFVAVFSVLAVILGVGWWISGPSASDAMASAKEIPGAAVEVREAASSRSAGMQIDRDSGRRPASVAD